MDWKFNDGRREEAGYKGDTGDCGTRSIVIALDLPYKEVYDLVNTFGKRERRSKNRSSKSSARTGIYKPTFKRIMVHLGWEWTPTMFIGSGCKVHLRDGELPMGRLIVAVSKHWCAVIDGVIQDTYDPSRDGTRCVYGYFMEAKG